jgi:hypothetical protein
LKSDVVNGINEQAVYHVGRFYKAFCVINREDIVKAKRNKAKNLWKCRSFMSLLDVILNRGSIYSITEKGTKNMDVI